MTVGYYSTAAGSFGFQAGGQSKALIYLFMTQDALDKFRTSSGWTAGADASVSLIKVGANGTIDTASVSNSVNAFALTNAGLYGGVTLNGSKISKKDF
jgi:lipid-binding SYLF domain-containing protein